MTGKRLAIFYFSGTGNTWWASEQIAAGMQARGWEAKAHSIEQVSENEVKTLIKVTDVVGFGFPIYGSDAPKNFHAFLDALPVQNTPKTTLGFVTQYGWSGDGFNFLGGMMQEKGYRLRWTAEFNMFNNISVPLTFFFPYVSDYDKMKPKLKRLEKRVADICDQIASDKEYRQHNGWHNRASAWIQRGPFRAIHDWGRKFWSVEMEKCTQCQRCVHICPVDNIEMQDGKVVHKNGCVYCMRCFNYCPTFAIHYMGMGNQRVERKVPFRGPVREFKPEMIAKRK